MVDLRKEKKFYGWINWREASGRLCDEQAILLKGRFNEGGNGARNGYGPECWVR